MSDTNNNSITTSGKFTPLATPPGAIPVPTQSSLDNILGIIEMVAQSAEVLTTFNPVIGLASTLAASLVRIAQAAVKAHEQVTGQPIDLSLLQHIDPVK